MDEIRGKDFVLAPSRYVKFLNHDLEIDFEREMSAIQARVKSVIDEEKKAQQELASALMEVGYGIE